MVVHTKATYPPTLSLSTPKCLLMFICRDKSKPGPCFLHLRIESTVSQQCLVNGKHLGLSPRQRCSGSFWTVCKNCHHPGIDVSWTRCPLGTSAPSGLPTLLPNQTWVHLPVCSKANLLTLDCGEGKCNIYCRIPNKLSS